jgi:YidC/Oxa1 family membrane protein insertase
VLIALFFVFRNTIELRGVAFAWLPDLASQDPYYILPVLLGMSMFLMQWITLRTMDDSNPQMKMMLWFLPIFMVVMFATLPAGLNLYYLTANIATLPQSWWIAQERKKVRATVA